MHFSNILTCLALPTVLFASASAAVSLGGVTQPLTSNVDRVAGSGGESFKLYNGKPVAVAVIYSRRPDGQYGYPLDGDGFIIHRIVVSFERGGDQSAGSVVENNEHEGSYHHDSGKILNMTIWAGDYVDAVSYIAERWDLMTGGLGGSPIEQDVGNGVLMGFKGTLKDGFMTSLEGIFGK